MKKAVFPGSFDPLTIGHESIIKRALPLFDEIIIAIGHNVNKQGFFPLEDRKRWISEVFKDEPKIKIDHFEGLTIDYCKKIGASYLLRGLRTSADFEYERAIAQVNKAMYEGIETIFLLTMPEHTPVNSTIVRDIIRNGGNVSKFIPKGMNIYENKK
ncbi:MAG: pantetheine-phosphate adenylyltransferase [Bacteroidales bacterium]